MANDLEDKAFALVIRDEYKGLNRRTRDHVMDRLMKEIQFHRIGDTDETLQDAAINKRVVLSLRGLLTLLSGGTTHYKGSIVHTTVIAPRTQHLDWQTHDELIDLLELSNTPLSMLWFDFVKLCK